MSWAEFLARIIVTFDLDPIIDVAILVSLAEASDRIDVTEADVEEWVALLTSQSGE